MKVLITGSGGHIGGHLTNELSRRGAQVVGVDIKPYHEWYQSSNGIGVDSTDLRERREVRELMKTTGPFDYVFNLAADMGGIGYISNEKTACMLSVLINTNLLLECQPGTRYFFASSACIYPAHAQTSVDAPPLAENMAYPADCEDGYGWEKLFSERMCQSFREEHGIETRIARFHNVYGAHGTYAGGREKAPAAICRKVAEAIYGGDNIIEIWGDGEQTRSFMHVDDCVEGIIRIAQGLYPEPLNLGSSELVTINQLVDIVEEIAFERSGVLERRYLPNKPQGVRGRNSDNTLIQEVYRWQPRTSLRDGLARTYPWIAAEVKKKRLH